MANWPIPAHGVISLSNSSRFPLMPYSNVVNRVVLPPGRARLATSPSPTGSIGYGSGTSSTPWIFDAQVPPIWLAVTVPALLSALAAS
jgi:hypothetical protein